MPPPLPLSVPPQPANVAALQSAGTNPPITQLNVSGAKYNPPSWDSMKPDQQGSRLGKMPLSAASVLGSAVIGPSGPPRDPARAVNQPPVHVQARNAPSSASITPLASDPSLPIARSVRSSTVNTPWKSSRNQNFPTPVVPLKRSLSAMLSWEEWAALDDEEDAGFRPSPRAQSPPLTVHPFSSNIVPKSSPQMHFNIFGSPSTSTLGNVSSTPDPQRRSSSSLRLGSEGVVSVVKANDARPPVSAHVSVKLEGEVSQADATILSVVTERPRSGIGDPVSQVSCADSSKACYLLTRVGVHS